MSQGCQLSSLTFSPSFRLAFTGTSTGTLPRQVSALAVKLDNQQLSLSSHFHKTFSAVGCSPESSSYSLLSRFQRKLQSPLRHFAQVPFIQVCLFSCRYHWGPFPSAGNCARVMKTGGLQLDPGFVPKIKSLFQISGIEPAFLPFFRHPPTSRPSIFTGSVSNPSTCRIACLCPSCPVAQASRSQRAHWVIGYIPVYSFHLPLLGTPHQGCSHFSQLPSRSSAVQLPGPEHHPPPAVTT